MEISNLLDKIKDILGKKANDISILEEQVDINLQLEYFEFARKHKKDVPKEEILQNMDNLFNQDYSIEEKKVLLIQLASIENVEAYRCIEKYCQAPDEELKNWAKMALHESRMSIESFLLDENRIFISTGLGGKGSKLRYFVLISSNKGIDFTDFQKKMVEIEFHDRLKKHNAEIEEIQFAENFFTILLLIPMNTSIHKAFHDAIQECNQYGNFIAKNFIVSNIKVWTLDEIKDFMKNDKEFLKAIQDDSIEKKEDDAIE